MKCLICGNTKYLIPYNKLYMCCDCRDKIEKIKDNILRLNKKKKLKLKSIVENSILGCIIKYKGKKFYVGLEEVYGDFILYITYLKSFDTVEPVYKETLTSIRENLLNTIIEKMDLAVSDNKIKGA